MTHRLLWLLILLAAPCARTLAAEILPTSSLWSSADPLRAHDGNSPSSQPRFDLGFAFQHDARFPIDLKLRTEYDVSFSYYRDRVGADPNPSVLSQNISETVGTAQGGSPVEMFQGFGRAGLGLSTRGGWYAMSGSAMGLVGTDQAGFEVQNSVFAGYAAIGYEPTGSPYFVRLEALAGSLSGATLSLGVRF